MRIALPNWNGRVSPLFDVARRLTLGEVESGGVLNLGEQEFPAQDVASRVKLLADLKIEVLICGAISGCLRQMIEKRGVRVVSNVCGPIERVLNAFLENRLGEEGLMMPGCGGGKGLRRRCRRRGRFTPQEPKGQCYESGD